jgi:hypothetical protein
MPRDLTEKNISLFTAEVLPRLRPIWDAEGWENHWWPRGNAAAAGHPAGSGRAAATGRAAEPADAVVDAVTGGGA